MTDIQPPSDIRFGEIPCALPAAFDAGLYFIGRLRTPWPDRAACPHFGALDGPLCRIELDAPFHPGLLGLETRSFLLVLYFMHQARRDLLVQTPRSRAAPIGTFAIRSPVRPNPIAVSRVKLEGIENGVVLVRGLDCIDGTPLIDLKSGD